MEKKKKKKEEAKKLSLPFLDSIVVFDCIFRLVEREREREREISQ